MQFLIERDRDITTSEIANIIQRFSTETLPKLQKWKNYYDGKQAILFKKYSDESKPCNKICVNFCREITDNYNGYLTGIPVKYANDEFENILDILDYNDVVNEDSDLLRNALIYGTAFEMNYIDNEGKQRFKVLDSRECIPVYANDIENDLLYVIRFWKEHNVKNAIGDEYYIEVYGVDKVSKYTSAPGFTSFTLLSEEPNYYGMCPVTVFDLNKDSESIFNQIIGLQDAYNNLISSQLDDWDAFVDAYLVLKGVVADSDDLVSMKANRVLMIDNDATAEYLTKSNVDSGVKDILDNYKQLIYSKTCCPDYTSNEFAATSGIAIRYKLLSLDNAVANIASQFKKALQRRIELITTIDNLKGSEEMWRDVDIIISHNLPDLLSPTSISELVQLRGLVSDETLLRQLPFVKDAEEEYKKVQEQNEQSQELYSFDQALENGTEETAS